jgi:WD40 repeat protein
MKRLLLIPVICLLCGLSSYAQSNIWNTKDAYLGQKTPGDKPEVFAEHLLVQRDTFPMDRVAFSNDGKEFYYPSNTTWYNTDHAAIRYFKFENGKWNGPFTLFPHYFAPAFSADGKTLYLEGGKRDDKRALVRQSHRRANGWSEPEIYLATNFSTYDFMPTQSGTSYIGSAASPDRKDMDICTLTISGKDTTVKSLGPPINTTGYEGDFFVAKDESYIILSDKESKTYECELWISFHKKDGSWTAPVSLGPDINNGVAHRWGQYVTPDGKFLFYSTGHGPQDCRIVWVRFDHLLAKLKKENLKG